MMQALTAPMLNPSYVAEKLSYSSEIYVDVHEYLFSNNTFVHQNLFIWVGYFGVQKRRWCNESLQNPSETNIHI